jgi:hypothetical protein
VSALKEIDKEIPIVHLQSSVAVGNQITTPSGTAVQGSVLSYQLEGFKNYHRLLQDLIMLNKALLCLLTFLTCQFPPLCLQ